jgi:hypothetical protein
MNDLPALFEGVLAELQQAAQHDKPATPPSADAAAAAAPACGPARCRRGGGAYAPSADVYETQDALVFTLSTPGWQPADINIEFDKGTLTISTAAPPSAGAAPQVSARAAAAAPLPPARAACPACMPQRLMRLHTGRACRRACSAGLTSCTSLLAWCATPGMT